MPGCSKKPAVMASRDFARMFNQLSKAALIDALWCACQLGTDESPEQIASQAARNAQIALHHRGDRWPTEIITVARGRIDSDPED
jgi:hypothetical protein